MSPYRSKTLSSAPVRYTAMRKPKLHLSKTRLRTMIEEATVDANGESEVATGWFTMIDKNLKLPFESQVLGLPATVESIDINQHDEIVAVCRRGKHRQAIPILNLHLPSPPPAGAEWIEAYRRWSSGW